MQIPKAAIVSKRRDTSDSQLTPPRFSCIGPVTGQELQAAEEYMTIASKGLSNILTYVYKAHVPKGRGRRWV